MAIVPSLPVTLQNGTTADATQVMANFNAIVSAVNANSANSGINTNITQLQGLTVAVAVNQGGTGQLILTPNAVLLGEGTSGINGAAPAALGTVLTSNGPGVDPSFGCPYAIGDLYLTTLTTNPSTRYVGTTWAAYAAGQVLIGVGSFTDGDSTAKTITGGQQLGEYQHTLVTGEMPSHNHTDSGHAHNLTGPPVAPGTGGNSGWAAGGEYSGFGQPGATQTSTANIQNTGGGAAHNNVQPSIGVYIWQRTA